jgi:hypothetical protein
VSKKGEAKPPAEEKKEPKPLQSCQPILKKTSFGRPLESDLDMLGLIRSYNNSFSMMGIASSCLDPGSLCLQSGYGFQEVNGPSDLI